MTEVNGLRLAYRGLVAGIAGGYVWVAVAMTLAALVHGDPLRALRPFALAISPLATSVEMGFVLGLMVVQAGGGLLGLCFAYFFGRFFTVRATLSAAAVALAVLTWGLAATAQGGPSTVEAIASRIIPLVATLGYGLVLGGWVPVRGEVMR